jgi:hypothetical protein
MAWGMAHDSIVKRLLPLASSFTTFDRYLVLEDCSHRSPQR